ncbi:hypothetical protein E2C01_002616 [Portunus trituberculatus]|uniref:Uncharacterized protein n=1 Tax=Portunus trituberculatus TaxID=210409 RepID=A0A5B7CKU2_PORTR|nr:hypothetical protein [Portunus trituberculatus]
MIRGVSERLLTLNTLTTRTRIPCTLSAVGSSKVIQQQTDCGSCSPTIPTKQERFINEKPSSKCI